MSNPRRTLTCLGLLAASAMLFACSPPRIEVEVQGGAASPIVKMTQDWGWVFPMREAPCIGSIGLYQGTSAERDPIWLVATPRGVQCLDLGSFVVGVTPKGFEQATPLSPDAHGPHNLVVYGIGWGEATFEL